MSWNILHGAPPKTARVGRRAPGVAVPDQAVPVRDPGVVADVDSDAMMISELNHAETLEDALLAAILEDDEDMSTM